MYKAILITILIIVGVLVITPNPWVMLQSGKTNADFVKNKIIKCHKFSQVNNHNSVVLRIDDVQAYSWNDVTLAMTEYAFLHHIPVTWGIIPKGISDDKSLHNFYLRNYCNIDVALHGWEHTPAEFSKLTTIEAKAKITKGLGELYKFGAKEVVIFIPPENKFSNGTASAASEVGLAISANNGNLFDIQSQTFDYENNILRPVNTVIAECSKAMVNYGRCIIMLHPQDYASGQRIDYEKFKKYQELLTQLSALNYSFSTLSEEVSATGNFSSNNLISDIDE